MPAVFTSEPPFATRLLGQDPAGAGRAGRRVYDHRAGVCDTATLAGLRSFPDPPDDPHLFHHVSTMCASVVLACAVGINVFTPGRSIVDRVFGAIVLYLLIGLIAAFAYSALYGINPGAFSKLPSGEGGFRDWLYFSFVTLTTLGYGDITPIAPSARAIAMLEALVGQLYPAIIIARFVSLPGTLK